MEENNINPILWLQNSDDTREQNINIDQEEIQWISAIIQNN